MSKTFYRPTITLQKTIGDQLYEMLQGPVFEYIRNECEGEENDESIREEQEVSAMLISERVFPNLFRLCQQAKEALNFEEDINFYITSRPDINAWSLSSNAHDKHPHTIELYSGLVNLMSEKELLFIIGHEIGHIINGDSQLRKLKNFIYQKQELDLTIKYRFDIYNLLCELGADRYGYIACDGDKEACIKAMYKLVSGFHLENVQINVQALIEENQKHLDYFMHDRDKHIGTTHPVHPIRIHSLHIYATAQTEDELELEMEKISNRFDYNLTEEDSTFNFFYVAAGVLIGTIDHELSEDQKWKIIYYLGAGSLFPVELFNHIREQYDLESLYHSTIRLLLAKDINNKEHMLNYLLDIAFSDGYFSVNELHFIYRFGHEVGWNDKQIAKMIEASFRDYFSPNLLHYSEETQQTEMSNTINKENINLEIVPIDLTPEEQEFDNLLTDQLIEVVRNPSMRKDFFLQTSKHEQYRFNKYDIPSELEHCALFRFNTYNDNYERALMWAEQTKDELIKHYMLSAYYRFSASGAPVTEENTQSLFLRSFEHGYQSYAGIPCNLFAEYAEYLMKSKNEVDLIELAFMVFAVGLHCMNPADPNVINTFNQQCTREEVELIQRMLQIIKEYAENSKEEETKDVFMNFYHIESAYYYACTGRIQLAKKEIALLANEYVQELYDFNNLTEEEREQRHEDLRIVINDLILDVLEEETEHLHLMKKYATMAFRFEAPPKRPRPQKGSFDWLYNQGEKSYLAILNNKATDKDYANIRAVAEAYRTGNGVRQNLRLAECWDKMAKL